MEGNHQSATLLLQPSNRGDDPAEVRVGSFSADLFPSDFWGDVTDRKLHDKPLGSLLEQVKSTMLVSLWMYIGIESAVVMSVSSVDGFPDGAITMRSGASLSG